MRIYMTETQLDVVRKAKEWYLAKREAERTAGQPVNWEDSNLVELEKSIELMIEEDAKIATDRSLIYGRHVV